MKGSPANMRAGRRAVHAGCFTCGGSTAMWTAANAQGVAAKHHYATGHPTWVDVAMTVFYGSEEGRR